MNQSKETEFIKRLSFLWFLITGMFALVFGFLVVFVSEMAQNISFFSKDNDYLMLGIIVLSLSLYVGCYSLVKMEFTLLLLLLLLLLGVLGVTLAEITSIIYPFENVVKDVWFYTNGC